jgi:PAS domain S-box-containing protein
MARDRRAGILVVDDNPNKLLALESLLSPLGQRVICATSGREALRHLLQEDFAVILLDVRMTGIDGFETAALIRQRRRSERTPIIFVTAFGQAEADMERGFALGAVDFVFSPISPEVLRNKVSVFVDLHTKSEEVRRQGERLRRLETAEHRRRLAQAETGRRQAEARYATMLDIAGDAIIAVDEIGKVVLFNKAAEQSFGWSADEVIGESLDTLIVGGLPHPTTAEVSSRQRREVRGRRRDGSEFPAEISVARAVDDYQLMTTVILRDITERRLAEESVRRLNAALDERLRTGIDMVADLAETLDPRAVLGRLLVRAASAVRADRGTLLRIDAERHVITDSYELDGGGRFDRRTRLSAQPLLERALRERRTVIVSPFRTEMLPAVDRAWEGVIRHLALVPLVVADQVAAVLLLGRAGAGPFSTDDVDMLELIGSVAVVALRNAELFIQAEESSRSKSDFLNMAAHELRTPLSVVRGYASMLNDGSLGEGPPMWRRPLEALDAKIAELAILVDDLLTAARTEGGRLEANPEAVDFRDLAMAAIERADAHARLISAKIDAVLPDEPVMVVADPHHTGRVLDNLVNNALTYTMGSPHIRIEVVASTRQVRVVDDGPGIPGPLRDRIFERFFRINDKDLGPRPGTGLGLYIGRALAERQGGTLELTATGPRGSTFSLILPPATATPEVEGTDLAVGAGALQQSDT